MTYNPLLHAAGGGGGCNKACWIALAVIGGVCMAAIAVGVIAWGLCKWRRYVARRRDKLAYEESRTRLAALFGQLPGRTLNMMNDRDIWPELRDHYGLSDDDQVPAMAIMARQRLQAQAAYRRDAPV